MFDRIISIDWCGANEETVAVDIRIALWDRGKASFLEREVAGRRFRSWSREACRKWLAERLSERPRTLVAIDFCFGLPWGADREVFGVQGWLATVRRIGELYRENGKARATAEAINDMPQFGGCGPFRFDVSRNDFHFYVDHGVGYYRLTEMAAAQAVSPWYLGSGATVGFHTITGLASVDELISRRSQGHCDFHVWPQEGLLPSESKHVLAEVYPSIYPAPTTFGPCERHDKNQVDAWKVLQRLVCWNDSGKIGSRFAVAEQPFGRIAGTTFLDQIMFEGWILGLN